MKDKFLLPSILAGFLQALLLFLTMDLIYWSKTLDSSADQLSSFLFFEGMWFFPCVLGLLFGCFYAAPNLLFSKKRNMLFYYMCSVVFFLAFAAVFFVITYVLPREVAHIDFEIDTQLLPTEMHGIVWGAMLLFLSIRYFMITALSKLIALGAFLSIRLVKAIRKHRNVPV